MFRPKVSFFMFNPFKRYQPQRFKGNFQVEQQPEILNENPLIDTFGRYHTYLRISLTEKCNLRCQYCMPKEGVNLTEKSKLLTTQEIIYLAKLFVDQGVQKIRLTGGEPTIRKDLPEIIFQLKQIKGLENVSITTNGIVLTRKLVALQRAGLDSLNISLDTLDPIKYEKLSRRKGLEKVLMGIDLALQLGYSPVKINCVVMSDFNENEVCSFVKLTKEKNVDVRFIEYMPFSGNKWEVDKMVPYNKMLRNIKNIWPDLKSLKNHPNDTSKAWKVPGYVGQLGFITSMSNMFCSSCNRLRITADGNLKVCLFGNKEVSLRDAIRKGVNEDDIVTMIGVAVRKKEKHHGAVPKSMHVNLRHLSSSMRSSQIPKTKNTFTMSFSRAFCTAREEVKPLTHVDAEGKANMVDVSVKSPTSRTATARGSIYVGSEVMRLIKENNVKKGDVLGIAKLAGMMAAKRTSELVPLCHNIPLNSIKVSTALNEEQGVVLIEAIVSCEGKTGVEMEALTAVSVSALTIYDMCKAVTKSMKINDIGLVMKRGGKSGDYDSDINVKSYKDIELSKVTVFLGGI